MWFTSSLSAVLIGLFPFPPCLLSQESCARVLLFRGASKEIRNYNSQTAFQVRRRAPGPVPPAELLGGLARAALWTEPSVQDVCADTGVGGRKENAWYTWKGL